MIAVSLSYDTASNTVLVSVRSVIPHSACLVPYSLHYDPTDSILLAACVGATRIYEANSGTNRELTSGSVGACAMADLYGTPSK